MKSQRTQLALFNASIAIWCFAMAGPANSQEPSGRLAPEEEYVGLIVKYKTTSAARAATASASALRSAESRAGVKLASAHLAALERTVYRFAQHTPPAEAKAAAARLALDPTVEYAVPDQVMYLMQMTPNDPAYLSQQWHLQSMTTVPGGANLPLAWQRSTGSSNVVVAVIDSGIRPGHPDLAGRLLPGYDFVSGNAFAERGVPANWFAADGNGRDADPTDPGDFIDAALLSQLPSGHGFAQTPTSSWHGTHVAGTIGATSNNSIGVAGVDWNARILPVRVGGRGGRMISSDVHDAILWAVGVPVAGIPNNPTPARIVNLSLGGPGQCDPAYQTVVSQARARGAILVVAAGNDAQAVNSPANCPGVVAVTAHARDGDNAGYASYGPSVAISAPGGNCSQMSYFDPDTGRNLWDAVGCSTCHSLSSIRSQINARTPVGLTYNKALSALNAALSGVDLGGQATGMTGALNILGPKFRDRLATYIAGYSAGCTGPSDRVYSTVNGGSTFALSESYGAMHGTSMAAPHVSGVASLMLSLSPQLNADEVRSVLQSTARQHPANTFCASPGLGLGQCGAGLLDADSALQHVANNRPTVTASIVGPNVIRPGAQFLLSGIAMTTGGRPIPVGGHSWKQTAGPTATARSTSSPVGEFIAPANGGSMGFEFSATDSAGYSAAATVSVIVNSAPTINLTGIPTLTAGIAASGAVTGADADGDVITYVLTDGPSGLTLNAGTGQWAWSPAAAGSFTMTVRAIDAYGSGSAATYTLNVTSPTPVPPSSSANPPTGGSGGGGAVSLSVGLLLFALGSARRRLAISAQRYRAARSRPPS